MTYFHRENFDFIFVPPGAGRCKMFRNIGSGRTGSNRIYNIIDPLKQPLIPVLLLIIGLSSRDERAVGTAAIAHIGNVTQGHIHEITCLDDTICSPDTSGKAQWSRERRVLGYYRLSTGLQGAVYSGA